MCERVHYFFVVGVELGLCVAVWCCNAVVTEGYEIVPVELSGTAVGAAWDGVNVAYIAVVVVLCDKVVVLCVIEVAVFDA